MHRAGWTRDPTTRLYHGGQVLYQSTRIPLSWAPWARHILFRLGVDGVVKLCVFVSIEGHLISPDLLVSPESLEGTKRDSPTTFQTGSGGTPYEPSATTRELLEELRQEATIHAPGNDTWEPVNKSTRAPLHLAGYVLSA